MHRVFVVSGAVCLTAGSCYVSLFRGRGTADLGLPFYIPLPTQSAAAVATAAASLEFHGHSITTTITAEFLTSLQSTLLHIQQRPFFAHEACSEQVYSTGATLRCFKSPCKLCALRSLESLSAASTPELQALALKVMMEGR